MRFVPILLKHIKYVYSYENSLSLFFFASNDKYDDVQDVTKYQTAEKPNKMSNID